ncbi:Ribosome biogenesis regulatory protein [Cercospora zeina]
MDLDETNQPQPYTFDLGNLMCQDPNPLPSSLSSTTTTPIEKEQILSTLAQKCAQALIHQLLAQPITRNESDSSLQISLPAPEFPLPREKPVPKEKEKTKWERFAEKKGIKAKRKDGKMEFDEERKEWKAKYGYGSQIRRRPGEVEADWIQEVDEKAERAKKEEGEKKGHGGKRKAMGDTAIRNQKLSKKSRK